MEFIKKRTPGMRQEERILTTELGLVEQEGDFPTIEESERQRTQIPEAEYIFLPRGKSDIEDSRFNYFKGEDTPGKGKCGYFIRYTGYVWITDDKPLSPESIRSIPSIEPLIHHPDDPRKLVRICRIQFFHRDCRGYAEAFWDSRPHSIHLRNLNPNNANKEARILLAARALMFKLKREAKGGRTAGLPKELEDIYDDYIKLCGLHMSLGEKNKGEISYPGERDMANFYGVNRSSLYRHLSNNFGITFSDVKSECQDRVKPIGVEELPYRFRQYLDKKRTEQATGSLIKR